MHNKSLCLGYFTGIPIEGKQCADLFEAIIGLLYVYLTDELQIFDYLDYITEWLFRVWNYDVMLLRALNDVNPCVRYELSLVPKYSQKAGSNNDNFPSSYKILEPIEFDSDDLSDT